MSFTGGTPPRNHLRVLKGTDAASNPIYKSLCGDADGQLWPEDSFSPMMKDGMLAGSRMVACIACKRTLERDALGYALAKNQMSKNSRNPNYGHPTLTKNEEGDIIAVTITDDDHRILQVVWKKYDHATMGKD